MSIGLLGQTVASLIKDNLAGKADGIPKLNAVDKLIIPFNNKLLLSCTNRFADISTDGDYEPWLYDPTTNSLSLLKDLLPLRTSNPNKYILSGGKCFFGARDEFNQYDRLFVTDATFAGTIDVGDTINKLTGMIRNFSRNTIVPINNGVLFNAYINPSEYGLWFSDGTRQGTVKYNDNGFADNFTFHPKHNRVVFTQDSKFKISDGTLAGTKDLNDLQNVSSVAAQSIAIGTFGDNFVMEGLDVNTISFGIFVTKGITNQYTKLTDFGNLPSNVRNIVDIGNGRFIFSNKTGLWVSDGTSAGTLKVPNIVSYKWDNQYTDLWTVFNGKVYFTASDISSNKGIELFVSDGTVSGTKLFLDINPGTGDSQPYNFTVFNKALFFTAKNATTGNELYVSDGTASNTAIVADINKGTGDSNPQYLTGLEKDLYFAANDGTTGYELWKLSNAKVGVQNIELIKSLNIYPTIIRDKIYLTEDYNTIDRIECYTEQGQLVQSFKPSGNEIILESFSLKNGIYLLKFIMNDYTVITKKILLNR